MSIVAEYDYDAFGNQEVHNYTSDNIASINPFRYRSYYYDTETNLYYLKSRYYSPELMRFLTPDRISILDDTMDNIDACNLYVYCSNNPVMYVDPDGELAITLGSITIALLIALGLLVVAGALTYVESQTGSFNTIGNSIQAKIGDFESIFNDTKAQIDSYVKMLVYKNRYDEKQWHHIVAKRDFRAAPARAVLKISGIGINDPENKVYVNNSYHRVLHTNAYYFVVNSSIMIGYFFGGGKEGVEEVLEFYQSLLGGLDV